MIGSPKEAQPVQAQRRLPVPVPCVWQTLQRLVGSASSRANSLVGATVLVPALREELQDQGELVGAPPP